MPFGFVYFSNAKLKYRLRQDYTQLRFDQPKNKTISEFVYVNHATWSDLVNNPHAPLLSASSGSLSTSQCSSPTRPTVQTGKPGIELYHTGRYVHQLLVDHPPLDLGWPPSPTDFTMENSEACIPPALYNLLALIVGATTEPTSDEDFINTSADFHRKLISICQDIVYLQSRGVRSTPKSLTLGMTVRHMTGSADLLTMLSRFGHCSSYETTSRYMTALATKRLSEDPRKLPPGFSTKTLTMIIWDNIDFQEETPTGSGTTHHTNGIMVQKKPVELDALPVIPSVHGNSRRCRSLQSTDVEITPYHRSKRQGPQNITAVSTSDRPAGSNIADVLEFSYLAIKSENAENQLAPNWNSFHRNHGQQIVPKSVIHYMPVVEASPTELSTVKHVLDRSIDMADTLQIETILLVFDQAIYAKAQKIRWNNPDVQKRTEVRLGEFHTCMSFLSVLGKRFLKSGFEDILVEAEVVAPGSLNGVMSGHMYNRSIRAHKTLYEALGRMQIADFLEHFDEKDRFSGIASRELELAANAQPITMSLNDFYPAFEQHVKSKCEGNPTYAFWNSYMEMVRTLLRFITATRESDWLSHLSSLRDMLPWFFAYDRVNYARLGHSLPCAVILIETVCYLFNSFIYIYILFATNPFVLFRYAPVYWSEMNQLKEAKPQLFTSLLEQGSWTVQRQDEHGFNGIAADQAIEQTVNRESKTAGGLKGITLDRGLLFFLTYKVCYSVASRLIFQYISVA